MSVQAITNKHHGNNGKSDVDNSNILYLIFKIMATASDVQNDVMQPLYAQNSELYNIYSEQQKELKALINQAQEKEQFLKEHAKNFSKLELQAQQLEINEMQQQIVQKRADIEKTRGKMEVLWESSIQEARAMMETMIEMAGAFLGRYNNTNHTVINKS